VGAEGEGGVVACQGGGRELGEEGGEGAGGRAYRRCIVRGTRGR